MLAVVWFTLGVIGWLTAIALRWDTLRGIATVTFPSGETERIALDLVFGLVLDIGVTTLLFGVVTYLAVVIAIGILEQPAKPTVTVGVLGHALGKDRGGSRPIVRSAGRILAVVFLVAPGWAIVAGGIALWLFSAPPPVKVIVDESERAVSIERHQLFGDKIDRVPLDEIRGVVFDYTQVPTGQCCDTAEVRLTRIHGGSLTVSSGDPGPHLALANAIAQASDKALHRR